MKYSHAVRAKEMLSSKPRDWREPHPVASRRRLPPRAADAAGRSICRGWAQTGRV